MSIKPNLKSILPTLIILIGISLPALKVQAQEAPNCGEIPSDVVLMLDRTSSVSPENRMKEAEAAKKLVDLLLINPNNRVAIGRFGAGSCESSYQNYLSRLDWVDAEILGTLSNDSTRLKDLIDQNMNEESCGGTDLHDAMDVARNELDFGSNPNRILILISDGEPNQPLDELNARTLAQTSAQEAKDSGIRLFTIAFDAFAETDAPNRNLLATLSSHDSKDDTIGEVDPTEQENENLDGDDFFIAPTGDDLEKVFKNIGEVILCDDENPCTTDSCTPEGKCSYTDNGTCEEKPDCSGGKCEPKDFHVDPEIKKTDSAPQQSVEIPAFQVKGGSCSLQPAQGEDTGWKFLLLALFPLPGLWAWGLFRHDGTS